MTDPIDLPILERIFSDAHIKDVDFSVWDNQLTLCVLADHYRGFSTGRCPVLLVRFCKVSEFTTKFNHLDLDVLDDGAHYQWLVDWSSFEERDGVWRVRLGGSLASAPELELACRAIEIEEIEHRRLDRVFPGWDRPYQGHIRVGVAALIRSASVT